MHALQHDPDLAALPSHVIPQVLQTLYVTSGCDYISFFSGIGKATFLRYFYSYANFITSNSSADGALSDVLLNGDAFKKGFLSFVRLIGSIYFKKNNTGFDDSSPATHFLRYAGSSATGLKGHTQWLEDIRQNSWDRIGYENDMVPSLEALWRHWKRSCWVMDMWRQADQNRIEVKPVTDYG